MLILGTQPLHFFTHHTSQSKASGLSMPRVLIKRIVSNLLFTFYLHRTFHKLFCGMLTSQPLYICEYLCPIQTVDYRLHRSIHRHVAGESLTILLILWFFWFCFENNFMWMLLSLFKTIFTTHFSFTSCYGDKIYMNLYEY